MAASTFCARLVADLGAGIDDSRDGGQRHARELRDFVDVRHRLAGRAHGRRLAVLLDVGLVLRVVASPCSRRLTDPLQKSRQLLVAHQIGHRMMLLRLDALPQHHLNPGVFGE